MKKPAENDRAYLKKINIQWSVKLISLEEIIKSIK